MTILCKYEEKIKVRFLVIYVFRKFMFCVQLNGKMPVEGAITSILKRLKGSYSKTHLYFFLIFEESVTLLYPIGASTSKYKKYNTPCNFSRVSSIRLNIKTVFLFDH